MREVILWGGTGQARVLNECLFGSDNKIVAVFDNASVAAPFPDVPLHVGEGGFRSWMKTRQVNSGLYFLVTVGGQDRLRLHDWLVNEGLLPLHLHGHGTNMPSRSRYTLLIPTYNRPDHLRRLLGYTPDALSYVRISPTSYGAAGSRSSAQLEVLRSWLELTRRPGWERRRAAFVAAAIWPDYRLRAVRALVEDSGYVTPRLAKRLVWLSIWTKLAPVFGTGFRRWVRAVRTQYRRRLWHTH